MNFKQPLPLLLVIVSLLMVACASKKEDSHDHEHPAGADETSWNEMDEFHTIMAETFHPYKDSANLEPVKTRASELMAAAERWAASSLPGKVDNDEMKSKLQQLKTEAATLAESVKSSDDNVIGNQLNQLHDTFHEIQEAWYGGH